MSEEFNWVEECIRGREDCWKWNEVRRGLR